MSLYPACNRIIHELSPDRCALIEEHDGPCRAVTWEELRGMFDEPVAPVSESADPLTRQRDM